MADKSWYLEFVDQWMERPENRGHSFTYWSAMYDWIRESRFSFSDLWIDYDIRDYVQNESWAEREWVEYLSDEALAEIVDISVLDEYGRQIQDEYDEERKDEIINEFDDWDEYQTREEFELTVQDACKWTNLDWCEVADEIEDTYEIIIKEEQEEEECDECWEVHSEDNDKNTTKE